MISENSGPESSPDPGDTASHLWTPPTPEQISAQLPEYEIEELIGRGGMGAVYKGRQIRLKRPVAIKLLPAELARTEQEAFVSRFQREAHLLASLNHPGIVTIYDFGQMSGGHLFFVMEYVDGTDLHQLIKNHELTPDKALKLMMEICEALEFAHHKDVIHRDIKPANVLLTKTGSSKLADFGLAMRPADTAEQMPMIPLPEGVDAEAHLRELAAMRYTRVGFVMGTPPYASPEVYTGQADERSDIFALGIMFYEMLTGTPPDDGYALASQKAGVDRRIDQVIAKALQGDPDARYQSVSEMKRALEAIIKPAPKQEPAPKQQPARSKAPQKSEPPPAPSSPPPPPPKKSAPRSSRAPVYVPPQARAATTQTMPQEGGAWLVKLLMLVVLIIGGVAAYDATKGWTITRKLLASAESVAPTAIREFARPKRQTIERIEGEAMKVLQATGGTAEPDSGMARFTSAVWSGDSHLFWSKAGPNDALTLQFQVAESGMQRLKAVFTRSADYGIVDIRIDGKPLPDSTYDFYAENVTTSGILDLGTLDLEAGTHELKLQIMGTNGRDTNGSGTHIVGLDYLQLEPPTPVAPSAKPGTDVALLATPCASFCPKWESVRHLNSGKEKPGRKSNERELTRQTWYARRGGLEWVQYDWQSPQVINECSVLWYEDSNGDCAMPAFWRLLYRAENGAWVPVEAAFPPAVTDLWSTVKFPAVKTTALRLSVQCRQDRSAGIWTWKAIAGDPAEAEATPNREPRDLFLGDLSPVMAKVHWSPYRVNVISGVDERNESYLQVGGQPCTQFLWAHANSRLEYAIPEGYTRFTALGIGYSSRKSQPSHGRWKYTVIVDGKTLAQSNELAYYSNREYSLDVSFPPGSKRLVLLTEAGGDQNGDHSHWAYPTLLTAASQKPITSAAASLSATSPSVPVPATTVSPNSASEGSVRLELIMRGAVSRMGGYRPQRANSSTTMPASIRKAPPGLSQAEYGEIKMGPAGSERSFAFIVDQPESTNPRLYIDSNANGDLTDDPVTVWARRSYKNTSTNETETTASGNAQIELLCAGEMLKVQVNAYRFSADNAKRPQKCLFYYADYARVGTVTLGGKEIPALLADDDSKGDFSAPTCSLRLDLNGDNRYDFRSERFKVTDPFNIGGANYELAGLNASGASFQIVPSDRTAAETKPLPVLEAGKAALPFEAMTLSGQKVSMPSHYKGKVVLLDFWAMWCGPCITELPYLTAAYQKHHDAGFEVLGISLDSDNSRSKFPSFFKEKSMTWPQVCDGQSWNGTLPRLYNVNSIPATFLVDGDTGMILAKGIRGTSLEPAIAKALADKKR